MPRNLILSGGVAHDFPATSAALAGVLAEAGVGSEVREDLEPALRDLRPFDLVTVNLMRWTMTGGEYAGQRGRWAVSLSARARAALRHHVERGGGLLAVHSAVICFDDWPGWADLLGVAWVWGRSGHPPLGTVRVTVCTGAHPIVDGVAGFDVVDEVYGSLDVRGGTAALMHAPHGGTAQPLLWARAVGAGRVVYDALGHHTASYASPGHREIVRRAALWSLGALDGPERPDGG